MYFKKDLIIKYYISISQIDNIKYVTKRIKNWNNFPKINIEEDKMETIYWTKHKLSISYERQ